MTDTSISAAAPAAETGHPALARLAGGVEERLRGFLAAERARWAAIDERAAVPAEALTELIAAGGKRLRPLFCLTGFLAAGGDPDDDRVLTAAAGLELLHACALAHDDVMDESLVRRGTPTVHVRHREVHRDRSWRGDPVRFGENVAILVGDLALIYADSMLAEVGEPAVLPLWNELRTELIVGQYLDVAAAAEFTADPSFAQWIAIAKSGHYTIQRPLVIGATLAGRPGLAPVFETYGTALGEAFQLRDDLLDAFGDEAATGKPSGLDFERHKMTLMLGLAVRHSPRIADLVTGGASGGADPAKLRRLLVETGVRDEMEDLIGRLVERGCAAVLAAPLEPDWKDELVRLAHRVAYRDS